MKEKIEQMIERYACENTPDVWQKIVQGIPSTQLPQEDAPVVIKVKKPHKWIPMAACLCVALVAVVAYKMQLDRTNAFGSGANGLLTANSSSAAVAGESDDYYRSNELEDEININDIAPQAPAPEPAQDEDYKTSPETGGSDTAGGTGDMSAANNAANNAFSNVQTGGQAFATSYDYQLAYDIVNSLQWFEGYDVVSVDVTYDDEFPNVMYLNSEDTSVKVYMGADALVNESLDDFSGEEGYAKVQLEEIDQSDGYNTILVCVAGEPLTLKMSEEDCSHFTQIAQSTR